MGRPDARVRWGRQEGRVQGSDEGADGIRRHVSSLERLCHHREDPNTHLRRALPSLSEMRRVEDSEEQGSPFRAKSYDAQSARKYKVALRSSFFPLHMRHCGEVEAIILLGFETLRCRMVQEDDLSGWLGSVTQA